MIGDHDEQHRLLGGYLLGGLDEAETERLDAHLRTCDDCRDELDQLAAVPELLRRAPEAEQAPGAGGQPPISMSARPSAENIEGLLGRLRDERRRENRQAGVRWLAAAAVVLVAAAISVGVIRSSNRETTPTQVLPSPQLVTAQFEAAQGSGMTGQAVLTPKLWGVSVALDMTKLRGEGPFLCEVRSMQGKVEQAATWGVTPSGNAKVIGASSFQLRDVSSVRIADHAGHLLGSAELD